MEQEDELLKYNHADTVHEDTVTFRQVTDRIVMHIVNPHNEQPMVEISGYDLHLNFNVKYLRNTNDIDAACAGISELFRELITEQLLRNAQPNSQQDKE